MNDPDVMHEMERVTDSAHDSGVLTERDAITIELRDEVVRLKALLVVPYAPKQDSRWARRRIRHVVEGIEMALAMVEARKHGES